MTPNELLRRAVAAATFLVRMSGVEQPVQVDTDWRQIIPVGNLLLILGERQDGDKRNTCVMALPNGAWTR
jgi:hypothetical protein